MNPSSLLSCFYFDNVTLQKTNMRTQPVVTIRVGDMDNPADEGSVRGTFVNNLNPERNKSIVIVFAILLAYVFCMLPYVSG